MGGKVKYLLAVLAFVAAIGYDTPAVLALGLAQPPGPIPAAGTTGNTRDNPIPAANAVPVVALV